MPSDRSERAIHWGILVVLLLNALWMITVPSFPTLDGWSHLHTARMLFDGLPEGVFCGNPGIVPNRIGHLVLGLLQLVLPALIAERVMLALIILGIGGGAYALARAFGGRSPVILLILPFTVNFLLVLGFHNFLLGLALALLLSAWWVGQKHLTWMRIALFTAAGLLLFYTHTTALILFLLVTGCHEMAVLLGLHARTTGPLQGKRWGGLLLFTGASLPVVSLFLYFNAGQVTSWGEVDRAANLRGLFDLRSILLYSYEAEEKFTYAIKLILVGTMILAVHSRFRNGMWKRPQADDVPLVVGVLLVMLYFILPDSSGYASYISTRLQLMGLVLLIVWMGARPIAFSASLAPVIMVLLVHNARNNHIEEAMAPLAERRDQLLDAARHLPAGSVVLPVSTEDNWLLGHIASLIAAENDVVLLDNYECATGYFPLVWCPGLPEDLRAHLSGADRCLGWLEQHIAGQRHPRIDRVVLIGYSEDSTSCASMNLRATLSAHFRPGHANGYARVFEFVR